MWNAFAKIAVTSIVTSAFSAAAYAVQKLVIDKHAEDQKAARELEYLKRKRKIVARKRKGAAHTSPADRLISRSFR